MKDLIKPTILGATPYNPKEVVAIRDRYQSYLYIKNCVYPRDIYVSNDDLVMVFDKDEKTKELYKLWREHKLN